MPDGVRLAARIWWPEGAGPFPAILEYIPYRKRDMVRARDERNHPLFAAHGYVCLRVDMRGSGDSEGEMPDMYAENELADARHIIEWINAQDWCSGRVGMFGTSWGGTASLQAAVDAPGPLKAVLANCATANRFEDDIHWMGGGLLTDSLEWGATLPAILAAPPDSATVGDQWRDIWQARLDKLACPLEAWIRHRTRGTYWRHGSVVFSADRLSCPILAIGGWADRYSNSVIELLQARPDLCWGIIGPWGHHYPDQGEPGPAMGFQEVALAWWNRWLKGDRDETSDWPRLRLWRREFDPPQDRLAQRSGGWVEADIPGGSSTSIFFLSDNGLSEQPDRESRTLAVPNDLRHGECAGDTGYFGRVGGLPLEQSADDRRALCFDSAPLDAGLDLIGHAEFCCEITRDLAQAQLVCRVCDVAPDGRSQLVTRQVRNLALDETLDEVAPFSPGEPVRYRIRLPSTAYRFSKGHRIRLALGTSYWPLVWPTALPASIRVSTRQTRLEISRPDRVDSLCIPLPKARKPPTSPAWTVESAGPLKRECRITAQGQIESSWDAPVVTYRFPEAGVAISLQTSMRYKLDPIAPGAASCHFGHIIKIHRADGEALIDSTLTAESSGDGLSAEVKLGVFWKGEMVGKKVVSLEVV